jgi:hypothetical protein
LRRPLWAVGWHTEARTTGLVSSAAVARCGETVGDSGIGVRYARDAGSRSGRAMRRRRARR